MNLFKWVDIITIYRILHDTFSVDLKYFFNRAVDARLRGYSFKLYNERYYCTAGEYFLCNHDLAARIPYRVL